MNQNNYEALLFDLDGTLVHTADANAKAYHQAFAAMGFDISESKLRALSGLRIDGLITAVAPDFDRSRVQELRQRKAEIYRRLIPEIKLNHDAFAMLRQAQKSSQKTALVTSASRENALSVLHHFVMTESFQVIVTGDDVKQAKPHPEAYLLALSQLGVAADKALAIEDSESGCQSATSAGLHVLRVTAPSSRRLTILMPMGGLGSRFAVSHPGVPKPLISVDGKPMFELALSSLDGVAADCRDVVIVTRADLPQLDKLQQYLTAKHPNAKLVLVPQVTRGSAETALAAQNAIDPDSGLVVLDCDLWLDSPGLVDLISTSLHDPAAMDGALTWFPADHPRYSYLQCEGARVTKVAEKQVISQSAIAGAYYFTHAGAFFDAVRHCCAHGPTGATELYISDVIRLMLTEGAVFKTQPLRQLRSFGTPEELASAQSARGQQNS